MLLSDETLQCRIEIYQKAPQKQMFSYLLGVPVLSTIIGSPLELAISSTIVGLTSYMTVSLTCPIVNSVQTLVPEKYMGFWFEQTRIQNEWFQSDDSLCTQALYFQLEEDGSFWVENSTQDSLQSERTGIVGRAQCKYGNGDCSVTFGNIITPRPNYQILDTDYSSYSIVYSCALGKQFLWVLTREPVVSQSVYQELLSKASILVPQFDMSRLISQEYQGSACAYAKDITEQ